MLGVGGVPASLSQEWLLDLLFGQSGEVTWAPSGALPEGFERAGSLAVLPGGQGRPFMVSLGARRGCRSALTAYGGLRPPRVRLARRVIGTALRYGLARPFVREMIDIGIADGIPAEETAHALLHEYLSGLCGGQPVVIAFGGGSGPYRKPVLQVFGADGAALGYVKVGWNDWSRDAVRREAAALRACVGQPIAVRVPELLHHGQWRGLEMIMTGPLPANARRPARSALPDLAILRDIHAVSVPETVELSESAWWQDIRSRISRNVTDLTARVALDGLADRTQEVHGVLRMDFGRWHGDLVPWNLAYVGSQCYAWDWEGSAGSAPLGFDAQHFFFQVAFVAERRPVADAVTRAAAQADETLSALGVGDDARAALGTLHLLELAVRHEEAHASSGDTDARFWPAAATVLAERLSGPSHALGQLTAERAA